MELVDQMTAAMSLKEENPPQERVSSETVRGFEEEELALQLATTSDEGDDEGTRKDTASLVVALFCDGFVCRHFTRKNGWIEGFAQSYDATSSYFLQSLERGLLPDGLDELVETAAPKGEVVAELWDYRPSPAALCPLTSADLPRSEPEDVEGVTEVHIKRLHVRARNPIVLAEVPKANLIPTSDKFPQLSSADLEVLTNDELSRLALDTDTDLLQVDASIILLDPDSISVSVVFEECSLHGDTSSDRVSSPSDTNNGPASVDVSADTEASEVDLVTPKRQPEVTNPNADAAFPLLPPLTFLSPMEFKTMRATGRRTRNARARSSSPTDESHNQTDLPQSEPSDSDQSESAEVTDEWVVKRSMPSGSEEDDDNVTVENHSTDEDSRRPRSPGYRVSSRHNYHEESPMSRFEHTHEPTLVRLSLSPDVCDEINASVPRMRSFSFNNDEYAVDGNTSPPRPRSRSFTTPLSATHLFWARMRGKRRRNYTIDELHEGSPAWRMIKHMNRFYQSAFNFERRHAQSLQVNIDRIMKADNAAAKSTKLAAGSIGYLATQLHDFRNPVEVIAAANISKDLGATDDAMEEATTIRPPEPIRRDVENSKRSPRTPRLSTKSSPTGRYIANFIMTDTYDVDESSGIRQETSKPKPKSSLDGMTFEF
ncbi:hypothetical protein Poli38472_008633 [Pythium oligandrum]|uniref:Uncharacterized protein n=1 Tax=Pythium oligandrum TaxID=41045 RepID=A0A8K1C3Z9_PYTOL|nr:hypothetical protein Poli38472_008633 [Pythium oligandrum]|eukprot:TMW55985.1 hypothetical protein Poli38472_008633 [Pythium oligandrum]